MKHPEEKITTPASKPEHPAARAARELWQAWGDGDPPCHEVQIAIIIHRAYAERDARVLKALEAAQKCIDQLMPGLARIAVQDYANINEARIQVRAAIAEMKGGGL